jgi:hypothetical protein
MARDRGFLNLYIYQRRRYIVAARDGEKSNGAGKKEMGELGL